ncbi:demethylepipodophyllotoxin synthase-like [Lactuca sativa]|uniref:demethylepipodophyllotoxin synthase-like n=1 Tax=Lactuca sativa TaxID=4236 RepID=UPI0022AEC08C|nr:demethylepipodophyllotoxin synthase-like [Lactuca sativa]
MPPRRVTRRNPPITSTQPPPPPQYNPVAIQAAVDAAKILIPKGGKKEENRAPPQAKGKWPVIGHLHLLGSSGLPHRVLAKLSERYGPIFTIMLGVHNALVVSSNDIAKECFTIKDKAFCSRPKLMEMELMGYNYAIFALAPYGDYWRQVRKIIMLHVLSPKRVEMLAPIRVLELRASMAEIYAAWLKNKETTGSDVVKLDMQQWFGTLILNGLLWVVAGKRLSLNDEEGIRFQKVARKFFQLLGAFVVSDFIPSLKRFDIGGYEREMRIPGKEMDEIFDGWLEEHKRKRKSKQQDEGNQVLMDVLISIVEGASEEEFPGHDSDTIIKATCLTMLIAGLDITAVT